MDILFSAPGHGSQVGRKGAMVIVLSPFKVAKERIQVIRIYLFLLSHAFNVVTLFFFIVMDVSWVVMIIMAFGKVK